MRVIEAAEKTIELWEFMVKTNSAGEAVDGSLGLGHCKGMLQAMKTWDADESYGKLCRWLGWMQAACVASTSATLEDMKRINKECAGDADPRS